MESTSGFLYPIREAKEDDWEDAMALAWRTFVKFEAKEYSKEGVKNFSDFISDNTLFRMFRHKEYRVFVALDADDIVGVISLRNRTHISLLFVEEAYHHRGIGRDLILHVSAFLRQEGYKLCTVNAAPYAVGFYHKLGFHDTSFEQEKDGIIYTPMEMKLM